MTDLNRTEDERDRLRVEAETLRGRAEYWKQRAKSAEGHLFSSDVRAAAKALHANTTQNETPFDELSEADQSRRFHGAWTVIAAINARRDRRLPHDSRGAGFMAANNGVCENCNNASSGKGDA